MKKELINITSTERYKMDKNIKNIVWGEVQELNDECSYTHVRGESSLGGFLITWKGWKSQPSFDLEESPLNDWVSLGGCDSPEHAMSKVDSIYSNWLLSAL